MNVNEKMMYEAVESVPTNIAELKGDIETTPSKVVTERMKKASERKSIRRQRREAQEAADTRIHKINSIHGVKTICYKIRSKKFEKPRHTVTRFGLKSGRKVKIPIYEVRKPNSWIYKRSQQVLHKVD